MVLALLQRGAGISDRSLPPSAPNFSEITPNNHLDAPPSYTTAMHYQQYHQPAPSTPAINPATITAEGGSTLQAANMVPPTYDSAVGRNQGQDPVPTRTNQ